MRPATADGLPNVDLLPAGSSAAAGYSERICAYSPMARYGASLVFLYSAIAQSRISIRPTRFYSPREANALACSGLTVRLDGQLAWQKATSTDFGAW